MPAETMLVCESSDSRDIDVSISSSRESSISLPSPSSSKQPPERGEITIYEVDSWIAAEEAQMAELELTAGLVKSLQT